MNVVNRFVIGSNKCLSAYIWRCVIIQKLRFLTPWGRVTNKCIKLPSLVHIMACRLIGIKPLSEPMMECCTLRNKLQWNLNRDSCIFIQENAFGNVIWKIPAILSRPQCDNVIWSTDRHQRVCSIQIILFTLSAPAQDCVISIGIVLARDTSLVPTDAIDMKRSLK